MIRYSACATNASLAHASADHLGRHVEPRAELAPLAAVAGGQPRIGDQRLAQARVPGAQRAPELIAHRNDHTATVAAETAHRTDGTAGSAASLDVRLDIPLPETLAVGAGTALFVCGTCFAPGGRVSALTLLVDGKEQPLLAHGMPRLDLLQAEGDSAAYRAGFWGFARIGPRPAGATIMLGLRANGGVDAELARIAVAKPMVPLPGAPQIAICMAAFEPPLELFERQVESIREQTLTDWICIVSDDCSDPQRYAEMERVLARDPRFVLSRSERRRGFYHNFERALELVPGDARYVALTDQDDAWDPDKLETLVRDLGDAQLVYSDQRIVSEDGSPIADTYWEARANNHSNMLSLLVANCVTGAASLFPADCWTRRYPSPRPSSRTTTTTGWRSPPWRSATSTTSTGRCTATFSTRTRRSGTRPRRG